MFENPTGATRGVEKEGPEAMIAMSDEGDGVANGSADSKCEGPTLKLTAFRVARVCSGRKYPMTELMIPRSDSRNWDLRVGTSDTLVHLPFS